MALVLIPQSLAYAALAGMPPERGLYAAGIPLLVAAPRASSPYLQTGPVAVTSLLTFGALSGLAAPGSDRYVALGLALALIVGLVRVLVGALRAGVVAFLMSRPMLMGFVPAATLLILASQLPAAAGVTPPDGGIIGQAAWTAANVGEWAPSAAGLTVLVLVAMFGGRRLHPLFPGVLVAVVAAILLSIGLDYRGATIGRIDAGLPPLSFDLPLGAMPSLLAGGVVIALVGFAEPASIARAFAARDRKTWSPNREFVSQGAANVAAGLCGGFPVGGSFSRSSLNRQAGARSAWSGALTGAAVLAFLPLAFLLSPLPEAVLAAIVIGAVIPLIRPGPMLRLFRHSKPQFLISATTFALTLALAPRIERAVVAGIALAIAVHLWRELRVDIRVWEEGGAVHLRPQGVLWFGAAQDLELRFLDILAHHLDADRLVIHLDGTGRLDLSGALALRSVREEANRSGLNTEVRGVQDRDRRLVDGVVESERDPIGR